MRVGLVYNLKPSGAGQDGGHPADFYAEWDDPATIDAVREALEKRHSVTLLDARDQVRRQLSDSNLDFVFNIAEGNSGPKREAEIPCLLESLGIPYTGSDPKTLALCLDKAETKRLLAATGIPTPAFALFPNGRFLPWTQFPAIVKPNWEGSSKGILDSSIVQCAGDLKTEVARIWRNYDQPALVEEFLDGREFTVGLLGNGEELQTLPIVEIMLDCLPACAKRIYSYQAKWVWDRPQDPLPILRCPANIPQDMSEKVRDIAVQTYETLGCRDWCRIDFRTDKSGRIFVLEANPLPGILPDPKDNSCLPLAARTVGMSYEDLILRVLDIASRRVPATRPFRYGVIASEAKQSGRINDEIASVAALPRNDACISGD